MSDLRNLLKKIKVSVETAEAYIYYDQKTGKIHKISGHNVPNEEYKILTVSPEEAAPLLTGVKRTDEFIITYDMSVKQILMKEVAYEDNHKTASTMCYQLPIIKNSHDGHMSLTRVHEGISVYIWNDSEVSNYRAGEHVWHNKNVYKLMSDPTEWNESEHTLYLENVQLTSIPTQSHNVEKLTTIPEYVGIHVDVWYKELEHVAGQHVWHKNIVYKLLQDQAINTEFTMDNVEIVVKNVLLYADENKLLETVSTIRPNMLILDNNSIYRTAIIEQPFDKDKLSILFYATSNKLLYCSLETEAIWEVELDDIEETASLTTLELDYTPSIKVKNGNIILLGKYLYQAEIDKEYDIIVQQNIPNSCWNVVLNPYTKKFLVSSGYAPTDILYLSVTAKYDPNILYKSLEFKVADLLTNALVAIPFTSDYESNEDSVSIYTAKYFDSYAHEVI